MDNPFAYLRKFAGLSQKEFCDEYGFAKQTVIGIEAGIYPELSDRMVISLGKACFQAGVDGRAELDRMYGFDTLQDAYRAWVAGERGRVAGYVNGYQPTIWTDKLSPMAAMVTYTVGSTQGFAKQLKVPPATLTRYAKGRQRLMPRSIELAFRQIGYPYLSDLIANQANWVDDHS